MIILRNIIPYEKDIEFDTKIAEITSISLEHDEKTNDEEISGEFIISGDYKTHQISVNKEPFMYKIPFTIELIDNIDKDSINIDINDFTYDIKDNKILSLKIELSFDYEEKVKEAKVEEIEEKIDEENEERNDEELDKEIENIINESTIEEIKESNTNIINNVGNENTYVTYHVYLVNSEDTIDSICQKFNVSKDTLHEFNDFDEIKLGDKLLIPLEDE